MYRNIIYTMLSLLMMSAMVGCESFFDKDPYNSTKTDEILTNEKDAQTMLNGIYAGFKSTASYGKYLTVLMDIMTDASVASAGFTNQMGDLYAWKINPGTSEVGAVWGNHYAAIYNANYLINNVDSINGDEAVLDRIKGEALTARALLHFNLVRLFGKAYNSSTAASDLGVPYITKNEITSPTRNTVAEVYSHIIADLEDAEVLLEEGTANSVSFTQSFTNGLMARVCLEMRDYEGAVRAASEVIGNENYKLTAGNEFISMWLNDLGSEVIWRVGYTPTSDGAAPGYNFYNRNNTNNPPMPDYQPAEWWVNSFNASVDVRYYAYLDYTFTGFGWTGHLVSKYPTNPAFTFQGMNMPKPMRLAEMYLIRAEANAHLNNENEARSDLNTLLENRILDFTGVNSTGDQLKEFIVNERQRELMFEGFHWFDLKRMNKGFERVPQANTSTANDLKIMADDYRWQWPIPTSELNGNDNIKQNEGY